MGSRLQVNTNKNAELTISAVTDSEERYRLLFENSVDAILEASEEGKILRANPAACVMFRMSEEAMRELEPGGLVSPTDSRFQALIEERRCTGKARGELTMVRADGSCLEAEAATASYSSGDGTIHKNVVIRDITERLQFHEEIVRLNESLAERVRRRTLELEIANRELKSFAHSLAHDLKAPIAAITGFAATLNESLSKTGSEKERHFGSRIQASARRMDEFVDGLLSLANISHAKLHMTQADLTSIASNILDDLQDSDRSRKVTRHVQGGLEAWGDGRLLRMLLQNLLGNAWKFTSRREVACISFTARSELDGEIVFSIQDNGAGFDVDYAGKLFGNFQRLHTDAEFPGMGIGLANSQRIVSRHGGRIWAESLVGQGATFSFTLRSAAALSASA
jgi:PAS domain S-box-containing protein